ncbi:MAG: ATP-binding protein [Myxococcales bacterium]|nr:ATP-binding protein [Myxococcales bacterium]
MARPYWHGRLHAAWRRAPIVWLSGVRRVGKTTLAKSIPGALYLNCDLPSTAEHLADPERFLRSVDAAVVVLDEVHQLPDPSRLLKIAADEHPKLRILATGSSTLAATTKFRDSLSGRKRVVHLLPVLAAELAAFGIADLRRRLLHGGLPAALLAEATEPDRYAEWLDSYFARDVQELFSVAKRTAFLTLVQTILRRSGGLCEITKLAAAAGLSRPTVMSYLDVLEVTQVATVLRPFHAGGAQELTHQPKIYGFDTGFVAWSRGWTELREPDCGTLWKHVVLETLQAHVVSAGGTVHYWRDKRQREVDFVVPAGRGAAHAIECQWSATGFETRGLAAFRATHPRGRNFLVVPDAATRERTFGTWVVTITSAEALPALLG